MSTNTLPTHKVTISIPPGTTEVNVSPVNPAKTAYIDQFLTRKEFATARAYIYPGVLAIVKRMIARCDVHDATIGGYISEIILDHFKNHRDIMQEIFDDNKESLF